MISSAYQKVSGAVFALVAIIHAVRAIQQIPVTAGTMAVPVWLSWVAVIVAGSLSVWAFRAR
jgi:hypothetical protein